MIMGSLVVETTYGQVKGERTKNVSVWKGIPYASPPVGDLRFRAPEPPVPWTGIYDATEFGPVSMQPEDPMMQVLEGEHPETSEDCLHLNIWSPAADGKQRPVMVWIHGGAFMNGGGSSELYDGTSFAENGDVVVVTINYRLGVMGFLHVENEAYADAGNAGILDQIQALKWVKENISSFGGDPEQVTVFGESAGAMSIGILLAIPAAKGFFQQAILQSGAASNVLKPEAASRRAARILNNLGVEADDVSALQDISGEKILEAAKDIPAMALGPVIDGRIIPEHPESLLEKGVSGNIPVLIGTNKDEYRLFTFFDQALQEADEAEIERRLHKVLGTQWKQFEPRLADQAFTKELYEQIMSDSIFTLPAVKLADVALKQGGSVWMYRFDWESPAFDGAFKACHAVEIPFVWNNLDRPGMEALIGDTPDKRLAEKVHQAWIAFAHHGNPNAANLPEWKPYDPKNRSTMTWNTVSKLENDPHQIDRLL